MNVDHSKAIALLEDWNSYKNLHYSSKTEFVNAVDIEIEKGALTQFSSQLRLALINDDESEIEWLSHVFEDQLKTFKDRITIELLKNSTATYGYS